MIEKNFSSQILLSCEWLIRRLVCSNVSTHSWRKRIDDCGHLSKDLIRKSRYGESKLEYDEDMMNKEKEKISRLVHQFLIVKNALNENETTIEHYLEGKTRAMMFK